MYIGCAETLGRISKVPLRVEGEQFKIADAEVAYMFSVGATFTF